MAEEPKDDVGRPYHVRLTKKEVGRIAFLPGDPGRVPLIARRFDDPHELSSHREYAAYGGRVAGEKVVVVSTGIGGPAAAIAIEELARLGVKVMIRVGTCGSIAPDIRLGTVIIADAAVRMDGTSAQYVPLGYPAAGTPEIVMALKESAAARRVKYSVGITASADAFYAGQGRESFGGFMPTDRAHIVDELRAAKVLCFEMEAATLFTLGRVFGLKTGALFAVVANRATNDLRPDAGVDRAIDVAVGSVKLLKKYAV